MVLFLSDQAYYSFLELNASTYLFPFDYRVTKETLLTDESLAMNDFGEELSIALKD